MKRIMWIGGTALLLGVAWWLIGPGIIVQQPIGAVPDGATVLYYGRSGTMPLIASADGICLTIQGSTSLLCRLVALGMVTAAFKDRIIVRLPYSQTAYLWSTGGVTFEP